MRLLTSILVLAVIALSSCKKDVQFTKDHLAFSHDTVLFDTVFTTVGSTTKQFRIYNYNNQPINIDAIQLMGGDQSPFRINVDGLQGDLIENIEIPANDSLFVFVEVTLAVNNATNPLVISDSVRFLTNGMNQYVNLDVWGQDAYFHVDTVESGVWPIDKPHVIYGTLAVGYPGIDSSLNLTIPAGAQVFCHNNAQLIVYKSSIDIQGTLGNEVVFQGDRLESFYDDVSGQWWGIRLIEAQQSNISYAIIKNGSVGLQVDSTQDPLTLTMNNTVITNHDFFALNTNAGPNIQATNCLIGDAGLIGAYFFAGGEYHFDNCNFVNYWPGSRGGAAFAIKNYFEVDDIIYVRNVVNSEFNNCVAYGTIDKEFEMDTLPSGTFNAIFRNNYLKRDEPYTYGGYLNCLWNGQPAFFDVGERDFHIVNGSVLIDTGDSFFNPGQDIEGNVIQGLPDIGCYEYQP